MASKPQAIAVSAKKLQRVPWITRPLFQIISGTLLKTHTRWGVLVVVGTAKKLKEVQLHEAILAAQ
ncbi:hypothetical protein TWF173_003165 [Orbilia oligospora]|nr:hypothetical protein TWF173_003165 [Orbilia oligospora]